MKAGQFAEYVALVGIGGFGLGVGLVMGAFVARSLRRYMRSEGLGGNGASRRDE